MPKHKLLLADDSITIQKVVNLTFADEGIEVISVGDGNSAMAKFEEMTPDLVMADINMPGLSGYEICERIKQNEETRRIPVILLVGSFEPFDEEEARRVGADDYLTKPFQSIRQLVTKVSDLLNSSNNDESASSAAPPNSFDDTLKMNQTESEELGDAGMDDEMIQANQVGTYTYDETYKYESQPEAKDEDYGKTQPLSAEELDEISSYQSQQPVDLSRQPIYGFTGESDNRGQDYADDEMSYEDKTQEFTTDESGTLSSQADEAPQVPMPQAASILELDEMNLLELPPRASFSAPVSSPPIFENDYANSIEPIYSTAETTQETESETTETEASEAEANEFEANKAEMAEFESGAAETSQSESEDAAAGEFVADEVEAGEAETNEAETDEAGTYEAEIIDEETNAEEVNVEDTNRTEADAEEAASVETAQFSHLSPEIIDAIAAKVVEKISDRVIREIAREVVPQMTDLIVKRLAEERLKE